VARKVCVVGLKHGKYIYVERGDGYYVKVRVLGVRFKRGSVEGDISDPSRYIIMGFKTKKPPESAIIVSEESLPQAIREKLYSV
jgi:hypothetical protein